MSSANYGKGPGDLRNTTPPLKNKLECKLIGVGEVLQCIASQSIIVVVKKDVEMAAGNFQVYTRQQTEEKDSHP